jgi:hypothetical protein
MVGSTPGPGATVVVGFPTATLEAEAFVVRLWSGWVVGNNATTDFAAVVDVALRLVLRLVVVRFFAAFLVVDGRPESPGRSTLASVVVTPEGGVVPAVVVTTFPSASTMKAGVVVDVVGVESGATVDVDWAAPGSAINPVRSAAATATPSAVERTEPTERLECDR